MEADAPHILVVDDDRRLRELLSRYLSENGFRVTTAMDGVEARARLASIDFDALVLDVMMPGEDGLSLTASLRATSQVPILLLTAMNEAQDRIRGLENGADDYLPKPFEPRELVLRLGTILRRVRRPEDVSEIRFGACTFDPVRGELRRDGVHVHLTEAEAALLGQLARSLGESVSREALVQASGGDVSARTIDVQVNRLRRKIEADPKLPRYLQTVRGTGYVLIGD